MRSATAVTVAAASFAVLLTSCGLGGDAVKRDPALRVGSVHVGMKTIRLSRMLGPGTPAEWLDDRGQHVNVLLYRNGPTVLAAVAADGRITGIEFYQRMASGNDVHNEFALAQSAQPYATKAQLGTWSWLGAPVFSDTLPNVPAGWNVPTDFTSAQGGKSFYIVRDGHAASKTSSKGYGWIVHLR